jgi:hypothetical protein
MAKANPFNVIAQNVETDTIEVIGSVLREEHGAHGLNFIDQNSSDANEYDADQIQLDISRDEITGELSFGYKGQDGEVVIEKTSGNRSEITLALSRFALARLGIPPNEQTSRADFLELLKYGGDKPNIEQDPSEWIVGNSLIAELCRKYPQYGNMVRYLCNERGIFMKVGSYPSQRAYWNSSLNGGLPAYKKSDPVHEGTFMLHDLFHFIPTDPLIGADPLTEGHKGVYVAHRLLSEACTLVLADMVAVSDAGLGAKGYDISKRKIYPVYQSILDNTGKAPDVDKLLAANAYFCFTGDPQGFSLLGASTEATDEYKLKYESIFRDDFMWNLNNYESMEKEARSNPRLLEYYQWLSEHTKLPLLGDEYSQVNNNDGTGIDITKMLSFFRADFRSALGYQQPIDDMQRTRLGLTKYLAGQRLVFARFGNDADPTAHMNVFDQAFSKIAKASSMDELGELAAAANGMIESYLANLETLGLMLPHEVVQYRFAVPLYPVTFVNYERSKEMQARQLDESIRDFLSVNRGQLGRLLEAAAA